MCGGRLTADSRYGSAGSVCVVIVHGRHAWLLSAIELVGLGPAAGLRIFESYELGRRKRVTDGLYNVDKVIEITEGRWRGHRRVKRVTGGSAEPTGHRRVS